MKSIKLTFALIMLCIFVANMTHASDFKATQPFLITAAGQGPDVTMVKVLAQKNNLRLVICLLTLYMKPLLTWNLID